MEKWAQIGDTNYSVSSDGQVRNDITGRLLSLRTNNRGYYSVHLYKDGKDYTIPVHRLVAKAFIPNPEDLPQVNHVDGNKKNNRIDNLEWITNLENMRHAFRNGLIPTASPIRCVETGETFISIGDAGRKTGIPSSCISDCLRGICRHAHGHHFEYI